MRAFRRAIRGVDAFLLSRFFLFLALVLRELARLKFRNSKSRGNDRRVEDIDDATTRCQGIPAGDAITVKSKISRYVVKIQINVARKDESGSVARNVTFILDNIDGTIDRKRSSGC